MNLQFEVERASSYVSPSQKIRIISEAWVKSNVYCPSCGRDNIQQCTNNTPAIDFSCQNCEENYELKSGKSKHSKKVVGGAYSTMISRLNSDGNPNLFLLSYNSKSMSVTNLFLIPKQFFTAEIIEPRKPLSPTAQRAGWIGCSILLASIPTSGKIDLIRNQNVIPKSEVVASWQRTLFLRKEENASARRWLMDVVECVEQLNSKCFTISDVYRFQDRLAKLHPNNNYVKEKIRQQLQVLRDNGYLKFVSRGRYEVTFP